MSAWLYLFVWAATLADQLGGVRMAGLLAGPAVLAFLLLELGRQRRAIRLVFLGLVAAGAVGVALAPDPWGVFLSAWRRGAAYAAFFLALGALREAAQTSPTVRRCGEHLVAQPAGRRTLALMGGGHLFGIILSYGAIDLLGAMVARAEGARDAVARRRGRFMLMAAYRGFATMNCWSPLNIMTAVVSAAVPAANMRPLLPIAFAVAMAMLAVGWLVDHLDGGTRADALPLSTEEGWSIHLRIVALVLLVMLLAEAVAGWFAVSLSTGVTAMVPAVGLGWVVVQGLRRPRAIPAMVLRRLGRFRARVPEFRGEAAVLAAGGFLGVALGAALPHGGIAPFLAPGGALYGVLPAIAVPLLVPVVLLGTGLLGLNPIAIVAVIGAAVPDPAALGVAPAVLAFACMLGWGVAVGMTPMSASAIATARWTGSDPWTVTLRWNAGFTVGTLLLAWMAIAAAHVAWSPALR
ncbi:MAG: hypothetical protein BGP12_07020 [Rhodospirillales bacterium 70-18]|nr:MAG: hypothetical protein BGP12_07020 [Rhodospirillales bacterium 70-18]